jgi:thiamine biosynthesis protein ThiC
MFLLDFRSITDSNGLLGFKSYLKLILQEIIEGKNSNTIHNLVLERLLAYYSNYRNQGDLDFRSGEIYNEVIKLSDKQKIKLAKQFLALLETDVVEHFDVDFSTYIKSVSIKDE